MTTASCSLLISLVFKNVANWLPARMVGLFLNYRRQSLKECEGELLAKVYSGNNANLYNFLRRDNLIIKFIILTHAYIIPQ